MAIDNETLYKVMYVEYSRYNNKYLEYKENPGYWLRSWLEETSVGCDAVYGTYARIISNVDGDTKKLNLLLVKFAKVASNFTKCIKKLQ